MAVFRRQGSGRLNEWIQVGRGWAKRDRVWSLREGARALRDCRQGSQGRSQAKGGSPVGQGHPCSQQAGDTQSGHSYDPGSPEAEGSYPVAGQVRTRPGRADTPETPEAQAGTRPQMPRQGQTGDCWLPQGPLPLCPGPAVHSS